ncbi:MFS transporter [Trujillonella endophytica]|uniref:Predicted arabinose efflux permease, MFS family n=1 Tax=Trujillonella endophytica TaxID=673521 RepID=A0A1H8UA33_9ACTN|nr:MFS transporter [Trujillella endophytica]SEO99956.1 Predicted arabinose efflux permease, MFS family [Trujillella endophytica]
MSPRTVLSPYARLFAVPGSRAFALAGWIGRLPASTLGLGTVLLVEAETDSYALAGAVSGTLAAAFALASPLWARLVDRRGQGGVLRVAMVALAVTGLAFLAVVVAGAPQWTWFVLAAATGGASPNVGSLVRARWAHALPEAGQRQTAFAFESVVDEVVFVVGPPLVTVLASLVTPPAGFLTGLLAGVVGGWALSGQRESQPPPQPVRTGGPRQKSGILTAPVIVVAVSSLGVGITFGAIDVVVVAFAEEEGSPTSAGLVLAMFAVGSLLAGLVYGLLRLPGTLAARFVACSVLFGVAGQLLFVVGSLSWLMPAALLGGMAIAPTLVSGASLVESRVPRASLTEALTWTMAGLIGGVTLGAALAGAAVDAWGAQDAFAVPALAAALGGVLALVGSPLLRTPAAGGPGADGEVPQASPEAPVERQAAG